MPFSVKQVFVSNDKGDNLDRLPYKHCLCHNNSDDLKCWNTATKSCYLNVEVKQ